MCDDNDDYSDDEQRTAHVRKAVDDIHELYRAGVPFFSKAAIQALVDQFDRTNDLIRREGRTAAVERERFFLRGLDGKEVRLRMETGVAHEIRNERWESFKYVFSPFPNSNILSGSQASSCPSFHTFSTNTSDL